MPIRDDDGKPMGAIQMINKKNPDGSDGKFDRADEKLVEMLASHVRTFIRVVD